jgi:NADH dehydrogenase FAD-containing subunit
VRPTLQIGTPTNQSIGQDTSPSEECIFALGDVARTGGPKQGRSCLAQGEIVVKNILALIRGKPALNKYIPHPFESALQLTLGKVRGDTCNILCYKVQEGKISD